MKLTISGVTFSAAMVRSPSFSRSSSSTTTRMRPAVWFETMRYGDADTGRMLRMSPETAEKIRARGAELIRGGVDAWRSTLLADNGPLLGQAANALSTKDCLPAKAFFDVIDGRATWRGREEMERHVKGCWHCLDHYCRLLEVVDVLRAFSKPLFHQKPRPDCDQAIGGSGCWESRTSQALDLATPAGSGRPGSGTEFPRAPFLCYT
jgi:hypothetical protein